MSETIKNYFPSANTSFLPSGDGGLILVTGGTGFLGAYIIKELVEKGYAVRAIRRSNKLPLYIPLHILEKVEWMNGDILDTVSIEKAMDTVDAVIHSAGMISFEKSERKQMYQVNIQGTANMVNIAIEKNINRFVYMSSVAALGRTAKEGDFITEEKKWEENKINTHYAITKHLAEMEVWRAMGEGLNAVIVNPGTILGYGDWNYSSAALFKNIYNDFSWYTTGVNGFVDVEDVAKGVVALMASDIAEERFIMVGEN
ncbi:MAG: SDR family NAD(P)-dependent oxidoreductase, partial [Bacteroidota bacterium]|nr:SDR family NAD(P)-dependent oxidoreductase [Bacteroidota bacterium]